MPIAVALLTGLAIAEPFASTADPAGAPSVIHSHSGDVEGRDRHRPGSSYDPADRTGPSATPSSGGSPKTSSGAGAAGDPSPSAATSLELRAAAEALRAGNDTKASAMLRELLATGACDDPQVPLTLASIHDRQGQMGAAIAVLEALLSYDPNNLVALKTLGELHLRAGTIDAARAQFERALAIAPEDQEASIGLARARLQAGNTTGARQALQAGPDEDPPLEVLLALAQTAFAKGDLRQARQDLEALQEAAPGLPEAWLLSARIAEARGRYAQALLDVTRAMEVGADRTAALLLRGHLWARLRHVKAAQADFDAVIAVHPDSQKALLTRGALNQELARHAVAIQDFSRVLDLNPRHVGARIYRASSYCVIGEHAACLTDADWAIAADPSHWRAHVARGHALLALERPDEALESYVNAVDLTPADEAQWLYDRLRRHVSGQVDSKIPLASKFIFFENVETFLAAAR